MISRTDIAAAAARIAPYVRHTPLLDVTGPDLDLGFPVTLKLELLQHAGSFKPRGAFNRMLSADLPRAALPFRRSCVRRRPVPVASDSYG